MFLVEFAVESTNGQTGVEISMDESEIKLRVRKIIQEELYTSTEDLKDDDPFDKLKIDTDDWTFSFVPKVESEFDIKVDVDDWQSVWTISQVAKLIQRYL